MRLQACLLLLAATAAAVCHGAAAAAGQPTPSAAVGGGGAAHVASAQQSRQAQDCSSLGSACESCMYTGRRGLLAGDEPQRDDGAVGADRALLQEGGSISFGGGSRRGTNSGRSANRNAKSGSSGSSSKGGTAMTCTACAGGRNMKLRAMPDGTQQCGCQAGYGAHLSSAHSSSKGSYEAYWEKQYLDGDYGCHTCPAGQVPFLPGSNLQLVWDGLDWWIELIDYTPLRAQPVTAAAAAAPPGANKLAAKAAAAAVAPPPGSAAVAAARPATAARIQQAEEADAAVSPAHAYGKDAYESGWYKRGTKDYQDEYHHDHHYVAPPLYPGQCVTCPEGSYQDGYECVADGPQPPSPSPSPPRPSPSPSPPRPSPSPSPRPSPSPSPPPSGYCCGGAACTYDVPEPPQTMLRSANESARPRGTHAGRRKAIRNQNVRLPRNRIASSPNNPFSSAVQPQTMCAAEPRMTVSNPPWAGTINAAMATVTVMFADLTPGTTCPYTDENTAVKFLCTGQQLAPYLVLSAAHCVESWSLVDIPGCANIALTAIFVCYDYNPQPTPGGAVQWTCPNPVEATGVSWHRDRGEDQRVDVPYDQAIIFTAQARPGPYFQYNYVENIDTASTTNTWLTRGFSWAGVNTATDPIDNRCGCKVCTVPCNLAVSGPRVGALTEDEEAFDPALDFNPGLEACGGSSGACMSVNGNTCCVGTQSYERIPDNNPDTCTSLCSNFWSGISIDKPLEELWVDVQVPLPAW